MPSGPRNGQDVPVLECVVNVSEGRDQAVLGLLARACGDDLLDLHVDPHHNRSVFTLVGESAPRDLAREAWRRLDLSDHAGVHPRLGIVDVVPFVALGATPSAEAVRARDDFARWAAHEEAVPCFLYGPSRTLPSVRKEAFATLAPDIGPLAPHPQRGAVCVGARDALLAWNLWLDHHDPADARRIAASIRGPHVRALGLDVGGRAQVSCNLVAPDVIGPHEVHRLVAADATVTGTELVGLIEARVLASVPRDQWEMLDLRASVTVEARIASRALRIAARAATEMLSR